MVTFSTDSHASFLTGCRNYAVVAAAYTMALLATAVHHPWALAAGGYFVIHVLPVRVLGGGGVGCVGCRSLTWQTRPQTVGLVQHGLEQFAGDRYAYLPLVAAVPVVAGIILWCLQGQGRSKAYKVVAVVVAISLAFGVTTSRQLDTWRSDDSVWKHAIRLVGAGGWVW